jgi:molybdenum cofactor cytidylyltransferase
MGIAAIVLAAGAGERMGAAKQLLPFQGATVLEAVVAAATGSVVDEVVVVTGFHHDRVAAVVPSGVTVVTNPDPGRGNLSSLRTGLSVTGSVEGIVLLLADHPEVTPDIVDALVAAWKRERPWAAVCSYRGVVSHPFLMGPRCLCGLGHLSGPKPLWRYLVTDPPHPVLHVPLDRTVPIDIDTPDDYRRLIDGV